MSVKLTYAYKPYAYCQGDNGLITNEVSPGIVGVAGERGEDGQSVYLSDFNPSNTYSKNIMLQKIDNNMALSNDSTVKIEVRNFKLGDWIICSDRSVYRLVEPEENSQYKFNLEYVGRFSATDDEESKLAAAIGGVSLNCTLLNMNYPAPTNRSYAKSPYTICLLMLPQEIKSGKDIKLLFNQNESLTILSDKDIDRFIEKTENDPVRRTGELYYTTKKQIRSYNNSDFNLYINRGDMALGYALTQHGRNVYSDIPIEEPTEQNIWKKWIGEYGTIDYYVTDRLIKIVIRT